MHIDSSSPVPVYIQVEQLIEQLILKQGLSAHELLPGVSVLSRQLSIAPLTVQKAYRRLQERGLIYSIAGKGTFVSDASDQQFIGLLVHNQYMLEAAAAPTLALLIQEICENLSHHRIPVRILTDTRPYSRRSSGIGADVMGTLEHGRPNGLIALFHYGTDELFELAKNRGFPVLSVGAAADEATARICFNHDSILRASLKYMLERRVVEPGVLWLDERNSPAERLEYLKKVEAIMRSCGATFNPDWVIGVHQATDWAGYHAFNHLSSLPARPQGLIVMDDVIGKGVHMGVLARQIRVPEDLVIAVQTNEDSPIVFPQQWQQCGYNLAECGRLTVETLRKLLAGEPVPQDVMCPFKWHSEAHRSPWNSSAGIRRDGRPGPVFRTGRQALEPVS